MTTTSTILALVATAWILAVGFWCGSASGRARLRRDLWRSLDRTAKHKPEARGVVRDFEDICKGTELER